MPLLSYSRLHFPDRSALLDKLRAKATKEALRAEQLNHLLTELSGKLSQQNIKHAVIKGPAVSQQFFTKPMPTWRSSFDLDILVDAKQLYTAIQVLEGASFQSKDYQNTDAIARFATHHDHWIRARSMSFTSPNYCHEVDLHWKVADSFSLPFKTQDLLSNGEQIIVNGQEVPTLDFNRHFVLICVHGYLDHFFRLKHLVDVFFALQHPRFDEKEVLMLAKHYGVYPQVLDSIEAAKYFFTLFADPAKLVQQRPFVKQAYKRMLANDGFPYRVQSMQGNWSTADKWTYIYGQAKKRSRKAHAMAPVLHRLKLPLSTLDHCEQLTESKQPLFLLLQLLGKRLLFWR